MVTWYLRGSIVVTAIVSLAIASPIRAQNQNKTERSACTEIFTEASKIKFRILWRKMPAASMLPSIRINEHLMVVRPVNARWNRGAIALFSLPGDEKVEYIMRIIGLPSDTVKIENGQLYINGNLAPREGPLARHDIADRPEKANGARIKKECVNREGVRYWATLYRQRLPNGRSFMIYECSDSEPRSDNTREFAVPGGHYFMMGDNRDNSRDSRFRGVGMVPERLLIGVAACVLRDLN